MHKGREPTEGVSMRSDSGHVLQHPTIVQLIPRPPHISKYSLHFPPLRGALLYSSKPESR